MTQLCEEPAFENGYAVAAMYGGAATREFSGVEEEAKLYGVIDAKGALRIPVRYDSIALSEGIALAREGEDYRYLTPDGAPLNKEVYFRAEPFTDGYAAVGRKVESAAVTSDPYRQHRTNKVGGWKPGGFPSRPIGRPARQANEFFKVEIPLGFQVCPYG